MPDMKCSLPVNKVSVYLAGGVCVFCLVLGWLGGYYSRSLTYLIERASYTHPYDSPEAFARRFYGLVNFWDREDYERLPTLAKAFFANKLKSKYLKVRAADEQLVQEVGCVNDFNILTDSQEVFSGFVVGTASPKDPYGIINIPVYFYFSPDKTEHSVILQITENRSRWQIIDIAYPKSQTSLMKILEKCSSKP